jgi:hypothetical protein
MAVEVRASIKDCRNREGGEDEGRGDVVWQWIRIEGTEEQGERREKRVGDERPEQEAQAREGKRKVNWSKN